ncbi:hypothetical protein WDW37_13840 [Bdellovibrionota bacterium FG-1]
MGTIKKIVLVGAWVFVANVLNSWAVSLTLSSTLAPEILSETVPTACAPFDLDTQDYQLEWSGPTPEGISLSLLPGSLQWVRVSEVLVVPRAILQVIAKEVSGGRVTSAGFHQALAVLKSGDARAEIPVALMSGDRNPIELVLSRGAKEIRAVAVLKFRPRPSLGEQRIFFDASCSRFGIQAEGSAQSSRARGWAYVGCRLAELEGQENRASSLELWVYWDNVGQTVQVGGTATASSSDSVWSLRVRSEPGSIALHALPKNGGDDLTLHYFLPSVYHRGFLGVGVGPYTDHFEGNGEMLSTVAPVITLYGSYFLTESIRMVAFDATTLDPHLTTDFGIYVHNEYFRIFDRRLVASLLLGGHAVGFRSLGKYNVIPGLPQGVELSFIDAFKKGHNFIGGFFIYPDINGKSYYNVWLRWGSGKLFGEFNYIAWGEKIDNEQITSKSFGVSIGFPIAQFL